MALATLTHSKRLLSGKRLVKKVESAKSSFQLKNLTIASKEEVLIQLSNVEGLILCN